MLALLLAAALLVSVATSTSTYLMAPPAAPTTSLATGNTMGYLLASALAGVVALWLGRWGIRRLRH
ncbi:hypothetical protein MUN82_20570 [Hymenobacter aerilatus]|uniref:Uncharacterized protein n=1 Tax=Hymenobacter aerilatus TaxID=2932251 RepID=A0A8T9SX49_9BACT|nr:hypothetical protein [Hymenobacter aerilatus]UOR05313.1 hypothetical protein MUN82_20570 [Hymenobacter aerilatus]